MSGWTVAWIMWLAMFGAIEGPALAHKDVHATLSQHVWDWFAIRGVKSTGWQLRRAALVGFLGWLTIHFLSGGRL